MRSPFLAVLLLVCGACGAQSPASESSDAATSDSSTVSATMDAGDEAASAADGAVVNPAGDHDGDGIDDVDEARYASDYLPFFSLHPSDACKTHGVLFRVSKHPVETTRIMIWFDVLYNDDCGASGHVGDDEQFGVVIDPKKPAPEGILAVLAISHQNTPCQQVTKCGRCTGMTACDTATKNGKAYPVLYPSKDKHGSYAIKATCAASLCDIPGCSLATVVDAPPLVNAGEPAHPLIHDLTTDAFITMANGWTHAELMHFDPWKLGNFGGAGDVSKDLVDPAFVIDTTGCL